MPPKCCVPKEVIAPPGQRHRRCIFKTESVPSTLFTMREAKDESEQSLGKRTSQKKSNKRKCGKRMRSSQKKTEPSVQEVESYMVEGDERAPSEMEEPTPSNTQNTIPPEGEAQEVAPPEIPE